MNVRAGCLTCVLVLLPAAAQAQTISGSVEGSGGAGSSTSNGQAQQNTSFWQGYTLGFSSPLINPKLIKLDTEVSFRSATRPATSRMSSPMTSSSKWPIQS